MTDQAARRDLVTGSMEKIRNIIGSDGVNRPALERVKDILIDMTAHGALFDESDFPAPTPEQGGRLFLISEDADETYSLYLVSTLPGSASPPHDHTTWAVIAGLDGEEENTVYKRLDDGSVPGKGRISTLR